MEMSKVRNGLYYTDPEAERKRLIKFQEISRIWFAEQEKMKDPEYYQLRLAEARAKLRTVFV